MAAIDGILRMLIQQGGDTLRLSAGAIPELLKGGEALRFFLPTLNAATLGQMVDELLDVPQRQALAAGQELRFLYEVGGLSGFQVQIQGGAPLRVSFTRGSGAESARVADTAPARVAEPVQPHRGRPPAPQAVESGLAPGDPLGHLLRRAMELGASDLHVAQGEIPVLRVDGRLGIVRSEPAVSDCAALLAPVMCDGDRARMEAGLSVDKSVTLRGEGRFRVNLYRCEQGLAGAFRALKQLAPSLSSLGMPVSLEWLLSIPHGLVLIAGPTGSGKSTTLAALAQAALNRRRGLLITLEDPIEYGFVADGDGALVRQRSVGEHIRDFASGLRDALREDPDLLLVGEMRDAESISLALTAAETGHLVLASLHSRSSSSAVERIIDTYPPERQRQIRVQLAGSLQAVVAQRLLPRASGRGRVPAVEILKVNHPVANLIREGRPAQIATALQAGGAEGMISMERCLRDMVRAGVIDQETARGAAHDPSSLQI